MPLLDILKNRYSVRAFLETPVPREILIEIFKGAQLSPSNCNVQPWQVYVISGALKDQLKESLLTAILSGKEPNPDFDWKVHYFGVHRERQFGSANALYGSMGIERSHKQARLDAMLRNWSFFDAPHVAFFTMEKYLKMMGAVDLGIYTQTLSLLMTERGISSCFQGALGQFPDPVRRLLNLPDSRGVLFGMSFGYADESKPVNATRTDRASMEEAVVFLE